MPPQERVAYATNEVGAFKKQQEDGGMLADESPILQATRHLLQPNGSILGSDVARTIEPLFPTFCSAIPSHTTSAAALASIDGRHVISHGRIVDFCLQYFGPALHQLGFGRGHRIAVVLPNGPELALCIVATAQWASCVPLSATGAASELEADLQRCGADLVIGPYSAPPDGFLYVCHDADAVLLTPDERFCVLPDGNQMSMQDYKVFGSIEESAKKLNIPFVGLIPSPYEAGIFRLVMTDISHNQKKTQGPFNLCFDHKDSPLMSSSNHPALACLESLRVSSEEETSFLHPNQARDEVLVLFTSGTTGNKKLVPHHLGDMLTASTTIALSWNLTKADVNCNLMPLFHVGGIVRQIFAPLISGGCVICCPSFDPSIFWALLAQEAFTWYYAAPTMHQLILQSHDPDQCPTPKLRMIANAAGGLLPSLAVQLRITFQQCYVLPSYGMTECMPISSPPSTYELTKPGTSGVPVGPQVAILNVTTMAPYPPNQEGPICVRGEPCFRGYGKLATADANDPMPESFLPNGWFNTGDLGYLDHDGYLYITGRSKEVINRGGEIISPMEVEEAVLSHPDIMACAAFSATHDVLQEVVGIVLVMKPDGSPRLDLMSLHAHLGTRLAAPKWPQCLVFLDNLPKSHTNKLLRVKLGQRFGLPELTDDMAPLQRTFEGTCPPQGTPLDTPIPIHPVAVSAKETESKLKAALVMSGAALSEDLIVVENSKKAGGGSLLCYLYNIDSMVVIEAARKVLDGYAVPTHCIQVAQPFQSNIAASLPEPTAQDALDTILQRARRSSGDCSPVDPVVEAVQELVVQLLKLDYIPGPDSNFFHLGGSSLLASQLASKIRKEFGVNCSGAEIFHHASSQDLGKMIRKRRPAASTTSDASTASISEVTSSQDDEDGSSTGSSSGGVDGKSWSDHGAPFETNRMPQECTWWAWIVQLIPMFVVFPIWQVTRYLFFFAMLLRSLEVVPSNRNVGTFVLAYLCFHLCWVTITPLVFVAIKWIVIGRYKAGRFPIWGSYYLRWWFVDICRQLFLRGVWGSNEVLLNFYYRLLGANIAKGARISLEADVAEFDLVTIGENAAVEMSTVRGFGVDNGAMILGPVHVGHHASVGARSVVAPYTSVPDNAHLGPATSSYDLKAMDDKFARVNRRHLPEPNLIMQLFIGGPISFLVNRYVCRDRRPAVL
jgi:acyl-coenzyme A synthetase/AMP-(fatty) acid ligase/acyl carrier protein